MNGFQTIQKTDDDELVIALPQVLRGKTLRVTVEEAELGVSVSSRLETAQRFAANLSRTKTDFNREDFNAYEQ